MSKRQRSKAPPNDDVQSTNHNDDIQPTRSINISISQLIKDCKITPYDAGNNKTELQIEFPNYFHLVSPSIQQRIIEAISSLSIE
tara:strand:- start:145 stop:399 length:255 start_codon:yes stop_codon:yes gene_type:complete